MKLLCILLIRMLLSALKAEADELAANVIARPGCKDTCGNVSIPFPFGIGDNCFLDSWFEINCNASKPFLSKFNIEVVSMEIIQFQYPTVKVRVPPSGVCTTDHAQLHQLSSVDLRGSPYNFSIDKNSFLMEGCAGSGVLFDLQSDVVFMTGCGTVCGNNETGIPANKCFGVECCLSGLQGNNSYVSPSSPLQFYRIDLRGQPSDGRQNCLSATIIETLSVEDYMGKLSTLNPPTVPLVLYWSWNSNLRPDQTSPNVACSGQSSSSFFCYCTSNSYGTNPYVTNGCQVPKECEDCDRTCQKKDENNYVCPPANRLGFLTSITAIIVYIALSIAIGPLLMVFGGRWLYYFTKRRKKAEKRVRYFKQMLQRHRSSNDGVVENTKLFTHKELEKATDHFNENRVLGKGGQGTVYKGMLVDGRIVAVKKSKLMDESQMEQFINEMVVLSQINHRNVVKVLGCCLETEVPLLVYEFISNGTLYQHIHGHPDAELKLGWPMRLKIAVDSAGAIAYLHSSSSTPVYHRDIKSANILLDDKYRAKVSDFGSSKTIAIDQTHLTTLVQGTIGYLDPEYFASYVFIEKSDVYSFGVVLLELLTSRKPIYRDDETMEQKSLVIEFFLNMPHFGLSDMLDPEVVKEAKEEQLMAATDLAKQCVNESGRLRPTMKEVAMALEMIIKPPGEASSRDQQAFPDKGYSEILMSEISDLEFTSSTITAGAVSPMYIDEQPLLLDTL